MKTLKLGILSAVIGLMVLFGGQSVCHAAPYLEIDIFSGVSSLLVIDNVANDTNLAVGKAAFSGTVGTWDINFVFAITYNAAGTPIDAKFDMTANVATGTGLTSVPPDLFLIASAINYVAPGSGAVSIPFDFGVGGTLDAGMTATYSEFFGASNTFFDFGTQIGNTLSFGPAPVNGSVLGTLGPVHTNGVINFTGGSNYSLSLVADIGSITRRGGQLASWDEELTTGKAPEPISLILLGSGLAGAGLYRRLRKPRG